MNKYSKDIEAFMSEDNLEGVIGYLKALPDLDREAKNKLIALLGRLTKLESDRSLGVISQEDYSKERNQIRFGIIQTSANFELRINKAEERNAKQEKILLLLRKYGIRVIAVVIVAALLYKGYSYLSYVNSINIPIEYIGASVNKKNLKKIYDVIESDSTIGNTNFNTAIKYLFTTSMGRKKYIELNDYDSTYANYLIDSMLFDSQINTFLSNLNESRITFDKIYLELEYATKLREEILYDTIQNKYKEIDKMCVEIQNTIDKKIKISENIKKNVNVKLFNVKINKGKRRLEARSKIRNGTGLVLFSVKSRVYICDLKTRDTLTSIIIDIDRPEGINAVYTQSLDYFSYWNQPSIYNAIKNYRVDNFYFLDEILEINANGENYNLWFDYSPNNLPYNAHYYQNKNYISPNELKGNCPYILYSNTRLENIRNSIDGLIIKNLKENDYHYIDLISRLEIHQK